MKKTTTPTAKKKTSHTGRSSTGKLASFTDAPKGPLSSEERSHLFDLIDDARSSNHRLLESSHELEKARDALALAKSDFDFAETDLSNERDANQRIHAEMAPLFHRLATV